MKKTIIAVLAILASLTMGAAVASADVTGDFKVSTATYLNSGDKDGGDVTVSGSVNHGAIQSGKQVVVSVSYDYSFEYQMTSTTTETTTIPARCPNAADNACKLKGTATAESMVESKSANWIPQTVEYTTTVTKTFSGSDGMTAITAPTVEKGRLNPKGKITGYNWSGAYSIIPSDSMVDSSLIPVGAVLVPGSVEITKVSYTTYLKDVYGYQIADTVISGQLFPAP